jgi:hypothetical protein
MPLRTYAVGDSDNTILRKFLENQVQIITGALTLATSGGGGGAVDSVFGRTGTVTADAADYASFYLSQTDVNTVAGSWIFTPATIPIAANAGTVDITKVRSVATNGADTTLTPSAAGTNGQQIRVDFVNSDTAAHTVTGAGAASTISFTAAASSTTTTYWVSNGSAWSIVGGAPTINDLATVTPVLSDYVAFWDASGGLSGKALLSTVQSLFIAARLGSHTSPDTTGGAITWTAPVYEVFTNTTTEYDLPAAAGYDGKSVVFYVTGTNAITIDPNGSEVIVRDGTVQTGGVTMTLTGVAGNYVALICDGTRWVTLGYKGTLAAGA